MSSCIVYHPGHVHTRRNMRGVAPKSLFVGDKVDIGVSIVDKSIFSASRVWCICIGLINADMFNRSE